VVESRRRGARAALDFDTFVLGKSPAYLGTASARSDQWHSIVGLSRRDPNDATTPWLPSDPLNLT
jgi:hypothetical protein